MIAVLLACKAPPDAPTELDQLVGYMFEHIPDEDDAALVTASANLEKWLVDRIDETAEGYTVETLSDEAVDALGEGDRSIDGLVGAAVGCVSTHSPEKLGKTSVGVNPMNIYNGFAAFDRDWDQDKDCFLAFECMEIRAESWQTATYVGMITVESHSIAEYRWVELDEGYAMFERTWLREPAVVTPELVQVEQQYFVWGIIPANGGARTIQATWVVATTGDSALNEDLALSLVVSGMQNNAEDLDAYIDGE
jgi:hypothetical protein